jgi:hypothetical protein
LPAKAQLKLTSSASASSRKHSGLASSVDTYAFAGYWSPHHDRGRPHNRHGRADVAVCRVHHQSFQRALRCCCRAPSRNLSLKMSPTSRRRKTRRRRGACDRCSRLWKISCPCLHCQSRLLPIECVDVLTVLLVDEARPKVLTDAGQVEDESPLSCSRSLV